MSSNEALAHQSDTPEDDIPEAVREEAHAAMLRALTATREQLSKEAYATVVGRYQAQAAERARVARCFTAVYGDTHDRKATCFLRMLASGADLSAEMPAERTPETVLRAMLASYEKAALEAEIAYYVAIPDSEEEREQDQRREVLADDVHTLRKAIAIVLSEAHRLALPTRLRRDFEARLRGDRPLDAPPEGE